MDVYIQLYIYIYMNWALFTALFLALFTIISSNVIVDTKSIFNKTDKVPQGEPFSPHGVLRWMLVFDTSPFIGHPPKGIGGPNSIYLIYIGGIVFFSVFVPFWINLVYWVGFGPAMACTTQLKS